MAFEHPFNYIHPKPAKTDEDPKANGEDKAGDKFRILGGADFIQAFQTPDWLIEGIIQKGCVYSCTSLTGHGKTAVWLYFACMIHAGRLAGNIETSPGNVLYLAGENPQDLQARMWGMCRHFNLSPDQMPHVLPHSFPMRPEEADALARSIRKLGTDFALIIGDTAAAFFPGDDDNHNVQSRDYALTLRTFTTLPGNPAVMFLAHPTKSATKDNLLPRGGGSFLNEVDGNLTLWLEAEITRLHWQGKIRGPDFNPVSFKLLPVWSGFHDRRGRRFMTILASPMDDEEATDTARQRTADEDAVLRTLREFPGRPYRQIARDLGWINDADQPNVTRVYRIIDALADGKWLERGRGDKPWSVTEKARKYLDDRR